MKLMYTFHFSYDLANTASYLPKRSENRRPHTAVYQHSEQAYSRQPQTVQKSMNRWMRRQIVIHPHSETRLPSKCGRIAPNTPHWVEEVRCIRVPTQGPHLCETPETMNLTGVDRKHIRGCWHLRLWGNFWGVMGVLYLDCLTGHRIQLYTKQVFYCVQTMPQWGWF